MLTPHSNAQPCFPLSHAYHRRHLLTARCNVACLRMIGSDPACALGGGRVATSSPLPASPAVTTLLSCLMHLCGRLPAHRSPATLPAALTHLRHANALRRGARAGRHGACCEPEMRSRLRARRSGGPSAQNLRPLAAAGPAGAQAACTSGRTSALRHGDQRGARRGQRAPRRQPAATAATAARAGRSAACLSSLQQCVLQQ